MKRKLIEKIPWQSAGEKGRMSVAARIHDAGGEQVLVVDFALDRPVVRIALSHSDFGNYTPQESPCVNVPRWGRRQYYDFRHGSGFFLPYHTYSSWETVADRKSADIIHGFVYGPDDPYHTDWNCDIDHLQREILHEKREHAEDLRRARTESRMKTVPEETEAFRRWAMAFVDVHIMRMIPFRGKTVTKAVCSACGREHEFRREMVTADRKAQCPCCGASCTVRRADYTAGAVKCHEFSKEVVLFQKAGKEFCERHFIARRRVELDRETEALVETGRIFHDPDCPPGRQNDRTYFHKYDPWGREMFWDDRNLAGMEKIVLHPGPVYPRTIRAGLFKGTKYRYCAMEKIRAEKGFCPAEYLNRYDRMPQAVEMMVKTGLYRLALETVPEDFGTEGRPWERLGISKNHLNRLRAINGGRMALAWMRYVEGTGWKADDEAISFFEKEGIRPDDVQFIADRMSGRQVMNYLVRQKRQGRTDTGEALRLWRDYLSMALRMKMDVYRDLVFRPKDVRQAHDSLVRLCGGADVAKRAGEIVRQYPDVDMILQSVRDKYGYADEHYAVVVPEKIEDIIYEGRKLGHCLDKSDVYFDRIQRRESFIVFLRKAEDPERPFYTLEIEPDGTARQKRTAGDRQDRDFQEAVSFIRKWQREVRKRLGREDEELAARSAELRKKELEDLRKNQTAIWHGELAGQLLADVLEADLMIAGEQEDYEKEQNRKGEAGIPRKREE